MPGIKINNHHVSSAATKFLDDFNSTESNSKRLALFDEYANRFDLLARCDDVGNTVLHIVIIKSSLALLCKILEKLPSRRLNCKNDLNETPLFQAVSDGAEVCALALKQYGASLTIKSKTGESAASLERRQPKALFKTKELSDYLQAATLLADPNPARDYLQIAKKVLALGFHLQQPISTHKHTLLHWLIHHAPCYVVENVVNATPDFNVNLDLINSNYLCEAILYKRWSMVRFFLKLGSNVNVKDIYGKSAVEHARGNIDLRKIKNETRLTVYEALLAIVNSYSPRMANLNKGEKLVFLFEAFIQFAINEQWQYSPCDTDYRENRFIFDTLVGQPCVVNCFNMAECFNEMLHMAGFENAKLHIYKNISSIPFLTKPENIAGNFACFDAEYHQKVLTKKGYYQFSQHCVVEVDGVYVDPTMCCFYDQPNAVVASTISQSDLKPCVKFSLSQKEATSLDFQPIAATLRAYFEKIGWDVIVRRKSLCAVSGAGDQSFDLCFDDDDSTFTFSDPAPSNVAAIVQAFVRCNPAAAFSFKLFAKEQLAIAIAKELKANQFDFATLIAIFDGDLQIKDAVMKKMQERLCAPQRQQVLIFSATRKKRSEKKVCDLISNSPKHRSVRVK